MSLLPQVTTVCIDLRVDARSVSVVTSASQVIAVAISPLFLVEEYDGVTAVDNDMVSQALIASLQSLDLVLNEFDAFSGQGYHAQMGQGCISLFEKKTRKNVLAFSPAYIAVVV